MKFFLIFLIVLSILFGAGYVFWDDVNTGEAVPEEKVWENNPPEQQKEVIKPETEDDKIIKEDPDIVTKPLIPGFVSWEGQDPYPAVDWSGAKPELRSLVLEFEKKWGKSFSIRQAYRPSGYGAHIRSVWELWRFIHGKSYTEGYRCEGYVHIDSKKIGVLTLSQKNIIEAEAKIHQFIGGDTPPACHSDHALGIAVDITPPTGIELYKKWIETGVSVGLCHYIAGDEPHWGVAEYLDGETDCMVL